ncbi:hypothetical protein HZB90_01465 [archaeon]|nr:hypothetical protein [archaeon]
MDVLPGVLKDGKYVPAVISPTFPLDEGEVSIFTLITGSSYSPGQLLHFGGSIDFREVRRRYARELAHHVHPELVATLFEAIERKGAQMGATHFSVDDLALIYEPRPNEIPIAEYDVVLRARTQFYVREPRQLELRL